MAASCGAPAPTGLRSAAGPVARAASGAPGTGPSIRVATAITAITAVTTTLAATKTDHGVAAEIDEPAASAAPGTASGSAAGDGSSRNAPSAAHHAARLP